MQQTAKNPPNFLAFHYTCALPNFIKTRPNHLREVLGLFSIADLAKHLFSPYKRLTITKKTTLANKLSFDLTSRFVGASTRLILIVIGLVATVCVAIFDLLAIIFYIFPIFSIFSYTKFRNQTFFESDLADPQKFTHKLFSTELFKTSCLFF